MDKNRLDERSSAEENIAEVKNSAEDDIAEKKKLSEDIVEESSSLEGDGLDLDINEDDLDTEMEEDDLNWETDEDSDEGSSSTQKHSVENLKENSSAEEDIVEESSSLKEDGLDSEMNEDDLDTEMEEDDLNWEIDEDSDEKIFTLEDDIYMEMLRDSTEGSSSTEEDSVENKTENFIEEHGLVFKNIGSVDRTVEFIIVGYGNCGKKELIEGVFKDHKNFATPRDNTRRIEYKISLFAHFHIRIWELTKTESVPSMKFDDKTVFLFCYEVDNRKSFMMLKKRWISKILEKSMKDMYYLLVGIRREPETQPKEKNLKKVVQKMEIELNEHFCAGRAIECSLEDKKSLLNVFQSAIDYVEPRF